MSRLTGTDAYGLMGAYNAVYAPQEITEEQVWEEVETWVNSLVEEGYDLSEYTWEDMYEEYLNEMGQRMTTGQETAPRAVSSPKPAPKPAAPYRAAGGRQEYNQRRSGTGQMPPPATPRPQASPKPTPQRRGLGNIPPAEGTGIGGPSDVARRYGRDTTSYQAGGGARSGQSVQATMQQGRTNLGRMDQGRPAPAGAKPTSGGSSVNPKSGLSAYSASKPAAPAPAARPAAGAPARPVATAAGGAKPATVAGGSPASSTSPARPSLSSQADEIRKMRAASLARQGKTLESATVSGTTKPAYQANSFDVFDVIKGHLIDEGYADTEEAALVIMANMSEEWKQSIVG